MVLYFSPEALRCTVERMAAMLNPGGILVVGAKENLPQGFQKFGLVHR